MATGTSQKVRSQTKSKGASITDKKTKLVTPSKPTSRSQYLHHNQRNLNSKNPVPICPPTANNNSDNDRDGDNQFQLELYWCIQTLENSLQSGKLNAKQTEDTLKTIKLLKNSKQPIIKKKLVMRAEFGDYRNKMADQEKKMRRKQKQCEFVEIPTTLQKSHFVKKSVLTSLGNEFKFNFPIDQLKHLNIVDNNEKIDVNTTIRNDINLPKTNGIICPSNNSFKFNFNVDV